MNVRDADGLTALNILFSNKDLGAYLLSQGADAFIRCVRVQQSAFQQCLEYGETWILEEFDNLKYEEKFLNDKRKCIEYFSTLVRFGYAKRASKFLDKGYLTVNADIATSLMKEAFQGETGNLEDPIETFELLIRLGAEV